jgi:CRISPR/Cas system-associated protein Csm6
LADYPAVPVPTHVTITIAVTKLREIVERFLRRQGDVRQSVVTVQDLLDLGMVQDADLKKLTPRR